VKKSLWRRVTRRKHSRHSTTEPLSAAIATVPLSSNTPGEGMGRCHVSPACHGDAPDGSLTPRDLIDKLDVLVDACDKWGRSGRYRDGVNRQYFLGQYLNILREIKPLFRRRRCVNFWEEHHIAASPRRYTSLKLSVAKTAGSRCRWVSRSLKENESPKN